jgi:hypothetical protein
MRIAHILSEPSTGEVGALAARYPILELFPAAQAALGHEVTLLCRSNRPSAAERSGVQMESVAGTNRLSASLALLEAAARRGAEVLHLHGITARSGLVASLARARLPRVHVAMQDQAFHWPRRWPGRALVRAGLAACHTAFFAARELAEPLLESGALRTEQLVDLPGGSSDLARLPRAEARVRTGLRGDPLYLWVARLAPVKDPLTAMRALREVLEANPRARLALAYGDDALLSEVRSALEPVREQVDFLGRVPHPELAAVYSAADVFVSSSLREAMGFALVEAMSCGVSPVVSAVPGCMATIGPVGRSFPVGAVAALRAALEAPPTPRAEVLRHYEERLSYTAIARAAVAAYLR